MSFKHFRHTMFCHFLQQLFLCIRYHLCIKKHPWVPFKSFYSHFKLTGCPLVLVSFTLEERLNICLVYCIHDFIYLSMIVPLLSSHLHPIQPFDITQYLYQQNPSKSFLYLFKLLRSYLQLIDQNCTQHSTTLDCKIIVMPWPQLSVASYQMGNWFGCIIGNKD